MSNLPIWVKLAAIDLIMALVLSALLALYILAWIEFWNYFGPVYQNFNPFYILAAPYKLLMESSGMKSTALIGTLAFAWFFLTDGIFAKRVMTVAFYPLILTARIVWNIIAWVFRKLFWKNQSPSRFMMVFRAFKRFHMYYRERGEIGNVIRTFVEFIPYLAFPPFLALYPTNGPWRARKETLFEDRNIYDEISADVKRRFEGAYISELHRSSSELTFLLHVPNLTGEQAKEKMTAIVGEIYRKLPGYDPKTEKFTNEILVERDAVSVRIERQPVFIDHVSANLEESISETLEWHRLLWYGPWEILNLVTVPQSDLLHSITISQSWWGKDVQTLWIIHGILKERFVDHKKTSIYLFDSKWSDWSIFDERERSWIFRYVRKNGNWEFADRLESLVADMREKLEKVGKYGNVERYDHANPEDKIGYTYVFINEALSLFSNESASETKKIASALIALLCEGRACGYRIHLLTQSLRGDSLKGSFGRILVNIDTVFAGRVSNKQEASIVWRQLDPSERSRITTLPKHCFLLIREGKIQSIFKPFYTDQLKMEEFLDLYTERSSSPYSFEAGLREKLARETADPKILQYLKDSEASGEYRWSVARDRGIWEQTFRKVGYFLKEMHYIEKRKGLTAKFVKPLPPELLDNGSSQTSPTDGSGLQNKPNPEADLSENSQRPSENG